LSASAVATHLTKRRTALIGVCAAGGLGAAAVLEAVDSDEREPLRGAIV
jgi:hypothetical protein